MIDRGKINERNASVTLEKTNTNIIIVYKSNIDKLERITKGINIAAMRFITGATRNSNMKRLYEETGFITIKQRCELSTLIMFYKVVKRLGPEYLTHL